MTATKTTQPLSDNELAIARAGYLLGRKMAKRTQRGDFEPFEAADADEVAKVCGGYPTAVALKACADAYVQQAEYRSQARHVDFGMAVTVGELMDAAAERVAAGLCAAA